MSDAHTAILCKPVTSLPLNQIKGPRKIYVFEDEHLEVLSEFVEIGEDKWVRSILSYVKDTEENRTTKNLNWFQWIWYKHKVCKEVKKLLKGGKF